MANSHYTMETDIPQVHITFFMRFAFISLLTYNLKFFFNTRSTWVYCITACIFKSFKQE
jgi:hypothetical protein